MQDCKDQLWFVDAFGHLLNTLIMNSLLDIIMMNFFNLTTKLVVHRNVNIPTCTHRRLLVNSSLLKFGFSVVNICVALNENCIHLPTDFHFALVLKSLLAC